VSNENRKPPDFNWVEARERCSLKEVFEGLRLGIREDVETRNTNRALPQDAFEQTSLKIVERGYVVRVFWDDTFGSFKDVFVQFSLKPQSIIVETNEGTVYEATIGLNENGDCKLKLNGKEYDPWQLRMLALEKFMFNVPK